MRLIRRRRKPTTAEKVTHVALRVTQAGAKVLALQRVARKSFKRYKLSKKVVPIAGLGAVTILVWRKVSGGGDDGGGGGGSQPGSPTPPTGPSTAATPTSTGASGSGGGGPAPTDTPPQSAEVVAAASAASDADNIPSPAATASGDVPDGLAAQASTVPPTDLTGRSGRSRGESAQGEGETPTEPELDIEGPNESAPGTHPTEAEKAKK